MENKRDYRINKNTQKWLENHFECAISDVFLTHFKYLENEINLHTSNKKDAKKVKNGTCIKRAKKNI